MIGTKSFVIIFSAIAVAIAAIVGSIFYLNTLPPPGAQPPRYGEMAAFKVNRWPDAAPDVPFRRADGEIVRLADFKGRVIAVAIWAAWCGPCFKNLIPLMRLSNSLSEDDFAFIALNLEPNDEKYMDGILGYFHLRYLPLYFDDQKTLALALGDTWSEPVTYLLDRQGQVVGSLKGTANWASDNARALIDFYIAQD